MFTRIDINCNQLYYLHRPIQGHTHEGGPHTHMGPPPCVCPCTGLCKWVCVENFFQLQYVNFVMTCLCWCPWILKLCVCLGKIINSL